MASSLQNIGPTILTKYPLTIARNKGGLKMPNRKTGFGLFAPLLALLLAVLFITSFAWADDPPQSLGIHVETGKGRVLSGPIS